MTTLHGKNLLGGAVSGEGGETYQAFNPATGETLETRFHTATPGEVDRAVTLAESAAAAYRQQSPEKRAAFLDRIAEELMALGDAWIAQANRETALPQARLTGERGRTVGQLRLFAELIREGSWVEARIDRALPDRKPLPRPDLRRMLIPIGPVAVFGASNFPFAFSVPGGDTASALAAGCPIVVKAHPAHPGTSEMAGQAILAAAEATGMPDGVFSLLHGGAEVSTTLVRHPLLQAVAFTGSLAAGRALFNAAAARERPIPVYAEMGSVNPVFVLPEALETRGGQIAAGLAQSVTLGVGQFCTNPGIVVGIEGPALTAFIEEAAKAVSQTPPASLLTAGICRAFDKGVTALGGVPGVRRATEPVSTDPARSEAVAAVFTTDGETFLRNPALHEEVFGPVTLIVSCRSEEEMSAVARNFEGQLTATVHGTSGDLSRFRELIALLETHAGRLVCNGFPTGVEVSAAMQHGGPYPASTDSRTTSVGTAAIGRFARPVCWQDFPQDLLPPELQDANPRGLWRQIDGQWSRSEVV